MSKATLPTPEDVRDGMQSLSALMMAAAFTMQPEVWPGFVAFVERTTGKSFGVGGPKTMDVAIQIGDAMRVGLAKAIGLNPGPTYPPANG
jgi:hypothetical protein